MAYGMAAAFCTWPADRKAIARYLVPGALSRARLVGESIRCARDLSDLAASLRALSGVQLLARGRISDITTTTERGFDFGVTIVEVAGPDEVLRVDFQNENLLARDAGGQVVVTVPDIITMVDVETLQPLTNADTCVGQEVAVFVTRAPEIWYEHPEGYQCWKETLARTGYEGPRVGFGSAREEAPTM